MNGAPAWPAAFRTARLQARALQPGDLGFIAGLHGDPGVMRHIAAALAPDAALQAARRILRAAAASPPAMHCWMLDMGDGSGRVGLMTVVPSGATRGELGLLFSPHMCGRGHATEAVAALLAQWPPGAMRLHARHRPGNLGVRRLLTRLGFVTVAGEPGYDWWQSGPAPGDAGHVVSGCKG